MPKNKTQKTQTEKIRQRLEEIKRMSAKSATTEPEVEVEDIPLTESDVKETAPVKAPVKETAVKSTVKADVKHADAEEKFVLDGASKFTWLLDGEHLTGYVRFNDATITVSDPVIGYTYSMPVTLPLAINLRGIGRLVSVDSDALPKMQSVFKLRSGEFVASMGIPISLPRIAWREVNKKLVWALVQFQPMKNEWRVSRIKSVPTQTAYEAGEIMRMMLGDVVYSKLREAIGLLSTPL
jgi:hypothetical protein